MLLILLFQLAVSNPCVEDSLQSPIDLISSFVYVEPDVEFYLGYQESTVLYHDGYGLKIDGDFGGFRWAGSYFWSSELIFKQPSEHKLKGKSLPMEMQISFEDQLGNVAILVALFSASGESTFLNEVGFGNPQLKDSSTGSVFRIKESVDIATLLGYPKSFLYYEGSSTTAPCLANVTWIVLTDTYKVSNQQLANFPMNLVGKIRSTQPLNGRKIYYNSEQVVESSDEDVSDSDEESLVKKISKGESYKKINDDFIVENESYLKSFPGVKSVFMGA